MTASGPGRNRWCFCTETNFKMHFNVDEPCFSRARTYTCTLATLYAHLRTPWLTDIWVKCSDWLPPSPPEPTPDPVNNLQSSSCFFGWKLDFGMHYKAGADILITRGGWTQVWKMCLMRPGSDRRARRELSRAGCIRNSTRRCLKTHFLCCFWLALVWLTAATSKAQHLRFIIPDTMR